MNCKFCGKPTEIVEGVYVCNECCTVSFSKDILLVQKRKLIMEYLNNIQKKLLEQRDYLHDIEQKHILGEELSETEFEIHEKSVRLELEADIINDSRLNEKNERKLLYRLLIMSKWLLKYFRRLTIKCQALKRKKSKKYAALDKQHSDTEKRQRGRRREQDDKAGIRPRQKM